MVRSLIASLRLRPCACVRPARLKLLWYYRMNEKNYELAQSLVPKSYLTLAAQAHHQREHLLTNLLAQRRLPEPGWDDTTIEFILHTISGMDSNNFIKNIGVGEREGRVASSIVARRHFRFAHGVGRSGEITEPQPKAAGASLISKLTNYLVIDAMRIAGLRLASAIVVPLATGMTLALTLLTLKQQHDEKQAIESNITLSNVKDQYVVLWPRIDQKSCLKSIHTAGFRPIPIPMKLDGDELRTDLAVLEEALRKHTTEHPHACVVVMTTTSCFAPRAPDRVADVAMLCAKYGVAHVVNNAYGLQDHAVCQNLTQAAKKGRVDAIVQSTDKNFMVPVGGAIIAGPDEKFMEAIAKNYPGRASGSPVLDLFITLLSLGRNGYEKLLQERKAVDIHHISLGMTLMTLQNDATSVGSMLFARNVSGVRVVSGSDRKNVAGIWFDRFGSHTDKYPCSPYLTAAAAVGMTKQEVDTFVERLEKVLLSFKHNNTPAPASDAPPASVLEPTPQSVSNNDTSYD